ncbi:hypothetical protein ABKN59_005681 [Abortiporus biennis]
MPTRGELFLASIEADGPYHAEKKLAILEALLPTMKRANRPLIAQERTEEYIRAHPPLITLPKCYVPFAPKGVPPPFKQRKKPILNLAVPFKKDELIARALERKIITPEEIEGMTERAIIMAILFVFRLKFLKEDFFLRYSIPLSFKYNGLIILYNNYELVNERLAELNLEKEEVILELLKRELGIEKHWKWIWWWDAVDQKKWKSALNYATTKEIYQDDF